MIAQPMDGGSIEPIWPSWIKLWQRIIGTTAASSSSTRSSKMQWTLRALLPPESQVFGPDNTARFLGNYEFYGLKEFRHQFPTR